MTDPLFLPAVNRVLCPQLYYQLKRLFGEVTIANEGEAMTHNIVFDYTSNAYRNQPSHSGEYYRVNCPFCGDTKRRLWVNHMYGQPDPASSRPMYWLATCYNDQCLSEYNNSVQLREALFGFQNAPTRTTQYFEVLPGEVFDGTIQPVTMPGETIPLTSLPPTHPAVEYMVYNKRYTLDMLARYQLSLCVSASPRYQTAQGRIVFPVIMNEQLVGWQCRYVGEANWKMTPKYYTLPGMKKRYILYNYDIAKQYPFVVVCEGPTSANAVGDHAVAVLGKHISPQQLNLLTLTWERRPIVLLLDPDAKEEMQDILRSLLQAGSNPVVDVVLPDGGDPNDLDRSVVWNFIYTAAQRCGLNLGV